jgi:hypothetical protein
VRSLSGVAAACAPRYFLPDGIKIGNEGPSRPSESSGNAWWRRIVSPPAKLCTRCHRAPFRRMLGHQNFLRRLADVGSPSHQRARHSATPRGHFIRNRTNVHTHFSNDFRPLARFDWKGLEIRGFWRATILLRVFNHGGTESTEGGRGRKRKRGWHRLSVAGALPFPRGCPAECRCVAAVGGRVVVRFLASKAVIVVSEERGQRYVPLAAAPHRQSAEGKLLVGVMHMRPTVGATHSGRAGTRPPANGRWRYVSRRSSP